MLNYCLVCWRLPILSMLIGDNSEALGANGGGLGRCGAALSRGPVPLRWLTAGARRPAHLRSDGEAKDLVHEGLFGRAA